MSRMLYASTLIESEREDEAARQLVLIISSMEEFYGREGWMRYKPLLHFSVEEVACVLKFKDSPEQQISRLVEMSETVSNNGDDQSAQELLWTTFYLSRKWMEITISSPEYGHAVELSDEIRLGLYRALPRQSAKHGSLRTSYRKHGSKIE